MAAGGMGGTLYKYHGRNVAGCVEGHAAPITALAFLTAKDNGAGGNLSRIFSGSMDSTVKVCQGDLAALEDEPGTPNLEPHLPRHALIFFFFTA